MKRAVLGVTGGIAAFKACEVVSLLRDRDFEVRVAMTPNATRFVTPLTFAALTGHDVMVDELSGSIDPAIPHVQWGRFAEVVVVAPATASFLARLANGLAEDSLGALLLALEPAVPVVLAPAMNVQMWCNPLVERNVARLRAIGGGSRYRFVEPVEKRLACGELGLGGLADPPTIVEAVAAAVHDR